MIDLSEVVNDSDFAQLFTVRRLTGSYVNGAWVTSAVDIQIYGIVTVASNKDLQMIPEGDRVTGSMLFHASQPLYITELQGGAGQSPFGYSGPVQETGNQIAVNGQLYLSVAPLVSGPGGFGQAIQRVSDQVFWHGQLYRLITVAPWDDFGYWRAIGVRMSGQ
jgi:hypothetical protein